MLTRRGLALVTAIALLAAGCGLSRTSAAHPKTAAPAHCAAVARWRSALGQTQGWPPAEAIASDVQRHFSTLDQATSELIATVPTGLRVDLASYRSLAAQVGRLEVAALRSRGAAGVARDAAAHGSFQPLPYVVGERLRSPAGVTYSASSYDNLQRYLVDRISLPCTAPDLLAPIVDRDTSAPAPPGRLVVQEFLARGTLLRSYQLPAGQSTALSAQVASNAIVPQLSRDGRRLALRTTGPDGFIAVAAADGTDPRTLPATKNLTCPTWSPDAHLLVTSAIGSDARSQLVLVDPDAPAAAPTKVPGVTAAPGCASFLDGQTLVFDGSRDPNPSSPWAVDGDTLWAVHLDGTGLHAILHLDHCTIGSPQASNDGRHVTFSTACLDPRRTGLYVADATTGRATLVRHGWAAAPVFSPDGTWLAFGFGPFGSRFWTLTVWLARADGSAARPLERRRTTSWPTWSRWESR